jgi:hypothetical protein
MIAMADEQEVQDEELEESDSRSGLRIVVWLLALGIVALFLPLYLVSVAVEESIVPLQAELESLQATITAPPDVRPEEVALTDHLLDLRGQLNAIEDIPSTLIAGHTDWPAIMAAVRSYDANRIRLIGFTHEHVRLTLEGNAVEESAVLGFSNALQQTGLFSRVAIQTISVSPQPTPTRPATPEDGENQIAELNMPFLFTLSLDLLRGSDGSQ